MSKRGSKKHFRPKAKFATLQGGFELGFRRREMFFSESDIALNEALRAAEIIGCSYGAVQMQGMAAIVPQISLVAMQPQNLTTAFEIMRQWGADQDGDVVSLILVLLYDGSYRLLLGPNFERRSFEMGAKSNLSEPLFAGATWIKKMDTTNPMLVDLREYLRSYFTPIVLSGATVQRQNGILSPENVRHLDDADITIFNARIIYEDDLDPESKWAVAMATRKKMKDGGPTALKPVDIASARNKVISAAFPVTRARLMRSGLIEKVQETSEFEDVTASQVVQSAINLIISRKITNGLDHYPSVEALEDKVWNFARDNIERADGNDMISSLKVEAIGEQLKRDVAFTLHRHGAPLQPDIAKAEKLFLRLGYGG